MIHVQSVFPCEESCLTGTGDCNHGALNNVLSVLRHLNGEGWVITCTYSGKHLAESGRQ